MGCDIHLHQEVKIDGTWHHYGAPDIDRHYTLFGKMAGVRNGSVGPISIPKGLPDDITFLTRYDWEVHWMKDGHSHSWLGAEEIAKLEEWLTEKMGDMAWRHYWGYLFSGGWGSFHANRGCYPKGLEDIRFVFWFDN